jgi:peptidyl-prolyl cis-trans isomerase D
VEWEYGSQRNYLDYMRRILLSQKMAALLASQGQVSEAELRASTLYELQQVRLAYIALETEALPPDVELTDQQIDDYLSSHEAEILALYEERQEDYQMPAQVKVRHILFAVDGDAGESPVESASERAEEALARLRAGEEFGALAQEYSDDLSSRDQGGDLGFVSPGELAGGLEEAAFSLEPGITSEIVRSDAGFHIVRVDERHEARTKTLDEVKRDLAREGAEALAARDRANNLSLKLAEAIRSGKTLEEAARDEEIVLERTALLRRRADSFVPGLGSAPELLATAFAMEEGQSSPRAFAVGSRLAMIQLIERKEPEPEAVESAVLARRDQFRAAKHDAVVRNWIEQRRYELQQSGRLLVDASLLKGG